MSGTGSTLASWPATAGEVLDVALNVWRRNGVELTFIALPLMLGTTIATLAIEIAMPASGWKDLLVMAGVVPTALAEALVALRIAELLGLTSDARTGWTALRPRALTVVLAYIVRWAVAVIGLFLLIVPGVWSLCRWFAASIVPLWEPVTVRGALSRSRALSRHATRFLLATVVITELVWIVASFALWALLDADGSLDTTSPGATAAGWLLTLLLLPPRMAVYVLAYGSRRRTVEALDLEDALKHMAAVDAAS